MAFLIGGANSAAADTGFTVANSCRINRADDGDFNFTPGGAGNRQKYTFSYWTKGNLTSNYMFFATAGGNESAILIDGSNAVQVYEHNGSAFVSNIITNRVLRDPSAWYHIVVAVDTTQGTDTNRVKIYINGVQETSYATSSLPAENASSLVFNTTNKHYVTNNAGGGAVNGYVAEVIFINDAQLAPTSFGEFDEDSPTIWKPIEAVADLTPGTNGFYLDFEDSSNLGNDAFGGTDLTENGIVAADQATDTPTNNFCTLNSINPRHANLTMSEGNCALASTNAQWLGVSSTMAVSNGKWYAEWKYISGHNMKFGIVGNGGANVAWLTANVSYGGYLPVGYEYQYNNGGTGYRVNNNVSPSWSNGSFSSADSIIMMAFDADAGKIWWGRNGTWFNNTGTANPATGTDASTSSISSDNAPYIISCALEGNGSTGFVNFGGCPAFAISSAVADGNGYGAFEYAPPSGFFSICTKNLAEYG